MEIMGKSALIWMSQKGNTYDCDDGILAGVFLTCILILAVICQVMENRKQKKQDNYIQTETVMVLERKQFSRKIQSGDVITAESGYRKEFYCITKITDDLCYLNGYRFTAEELEQFTEQNRIVLYMEK